MMMAQPVQRRRHSRWKMFLMCVLFFALANHCGLTSAASLRDFEFPSVTLSGRSRTRKSQDIGSPSELAWEAWLLLATQPAGHSNLDSAGLPRRITPKSVFIAPRLPACPDGYQADKMGRCVRDFNIDEKAHINFILHQLNVKFASQDPSPVADRTSSSGSDNKQTNGPLQLNIPLFSSIDSQPTKVEHQETKVEHEEAKAEHEETKDEHEGTNDEHDGTKDEHEETKDSVVSDEHEETTDSVASDEQYLVKDTPQRPNSAEEFPKFVFLQVPTKAPSTIHSSILHQLNVKFVSQDPSPVADKTSSSDSDNNQTSRPLQFNIPPFSSIDSQPTKVEQKKTKDEEEEKKDEHVETKDEHEETKEKHEEAKDSVVSDEHEETTDSVASDEQYLVNNTSQYSNSTQETRDEHEETKDSLASDEHEETTDSVASDEQYLVKDTSQRPNLTEEFPKFVFLESSTKASNGKENDTQDEVASEHQDSNGSQEMEPVYDDEEEEEEDYLDSTDQPVYEEPGEGDGDEILKHSETVFQDLETQRSNVS